MKTTDMFDQFKKWFGFEMGIKMSIYLMGEPLKYERRKQIEKYDWYKEQQKQRSKEVCKTMLNENLLKYDYETKEK